MTKKISFLDLFISIFLFIIVLASSTFFVLNTNFVFYFDIAYFDIPSLSGINIHDIKEIYSYTIDFVTSSKEEVFTPPHIISSLSGSDHFIDVRNIFTVLEIILIISLIIISISIIIYTLKGKILKFILYSGYLLILLPVILSIFFFISFEKLFVTFHEVIFTNDKWIFDPSLDPIITMLPEGFFMHCGIAIISLSIIIGLAMIYLSKKLISTKALNKLHDDISL